MGAARSCRDEPWVDTDTQSVFLRRLQAHCTSVKTCGGKEDATELTKIRSSAQLFCPASPTRLTDHDFETCVGA